MHAPPSCLVVLLLLANPTTQSWQTMPAAVTSRAQRIPGRRRRSIDEEYSWEQEHFDSPARRPGGGAKREAGSCRHLPLLVGRLRPCTPAREG